MKLLGIMILSFQRRSFLMVPKTRYGDTDEDVLEEISTSDEDVPSSGENSADF